jgi:murein DD-endopeptidase MepM/ murein hydrolase activator NlpD
MAIYPFSLKNQQLHNIRTTTAYNPPVHNGVDKAPADHANNIELLASVSGVLQVETESTGNKYTYIKGDDGRGYGNSHCARFIKGNGRVAMGDVIAIMGSTGHSTGIHTHFWIRSNYNNLNSYVDPDKQGLTYIDLPINIYKMEEIQKSITLDSDADTNARQQPTTKSAVVKKLAKGSTVKSIRTVTNGENVSGSTMWYELDGGGFVAEVRVVKAVALGGTCCEDLKVAEAKIVELNKEISTYIPITNVYQKVMQL